MKFEDVDQIIRLRIEFASRKKREGPGNTGTDPVYWEGLWEGKIRALQEIREQIQNLPQKS